MATTTTNLSLRKPDSSDQVSVSTDVSNNMELIDNAFASTTPGNSAVGDSASAGSTLVAARADHRHGRENFGTPVSIGAANANGSATTLARSDHVHGLGAASFGSPGASAVGDAAADGSATTAARADHTHGREAFGSPAASAVGDAQTNGSATTLARSDHKHAREAFGSPAASAVGDAQANGSASTVARSDHVHAREAFGAVANLTGADANGSATTVARSDHKHSMGLASQAAGDIFYATSASAFTRLGITAGGYLKGNSGGTAPEYSPAGQIVFPATQAASADANTLDDYEEGTFTLSVGGNATYTFQQGVYTKVGRLVIIHGRILISTIGTGSTSTMTGAPFTANGTPSYQAGSIAYFNSLAINTIFLTIYIEGASIYFAEQPSSDGGTNDKPNLFGNSTQVMFSIPYYV